eukprot:gene201-265_t
MATLHNTYKEVNTPSKKKKKFSLPQLRIDPRITMAIGILLQGATLFLCMAFISHVFHGNLDQSALEKVAELGIRQGGKLMHNWLGIVGATVAYYGMFRWFGITAFLGLPPLYLLGTRLTKSRFLKQWSLYRVTLFAIFGILWINAALGYVGLLFPSRELFVRLSGGLTFELGTLFDSLLGWGTLIALTTLMLVFIIFYFNVTSLATLFPFMDFFTFFGGIKEKKNLSTASLEAAAEKDEEELANDFAIDEGAGLKVCAEGEVNEGDDERIEEVKYASFNEQIYPEASRLELAIVNTNTPSATAAGYDQPDFAITAPQEMSLRDETTLDKEGLADYDPKLDLSSYRYPTIDLLENRTAVKQEVNTEELTQNKDKIVKTLTDFKIGIASIKATIGPTVTLYEIVPEAGVKISRIKNLEDDIALSLAALGIRIIAPIPGKGTIGIEVPNKNREMVPFKDMLLSDKLAKSNMELPIILGKSIANEAVIVDLVRMPHVLIAGATGQGKSVGLNVLLASLIYQKHPSQLKLVLVDPKKVELSLFSHLERHFLAKLPTSEEPIITETKKVIHTLNSLCLEMDLRYELLKQAGARNLKEYNEKFIKRRLNPQKGHRFLPYIVLVIDEFADMMMTAGKEVEMPIARLAQLARAIGIHLVLATQRPSVNVITGIIKANFPVRISFRVTSKIDSRTILDTGGAEQLVGQGDMLLSMNSSIIRLQCPFLDTHEVENVCDYIGAQRGYESAYMLPAYEEEDEGGKVELDPGDIDPLFEEAARLIVAHQQGSTSLIQRKLKLGYNRAGRLIDQLEAAGIVGPFEGSKAREVLVMDENSLAMILRSQQDNA